MKLYLVPFKAEAKVLLSIMPNCRKKTDSIFPNHWEYKGGEVISWNKMGLEPFREIVKKIGNFDKFSSVVLFGSAGSLSPDLKLGDIYTCTTIKDSENNSWQMPILEGLTPNSLLTTKALVFDNNKRLEYFKKYNCSLVDMEASVFAQLTSEGYFKQTKTYVVRFISDTYETLPPIDEQGNNYAPNFMNLLHPVMAKYRKLFL